MRVFISYRRADTASEVGRLFDYFVSDAGISPSDIFRDINSIDKGENFVTAIHTALEKSDVVLAMIGSQWVDIRDNVGTKRLHDPNDYVRIEIETALVLGKRLIPVIVRNSTRFPSANELPESLVPITLLNGSSLRDDPDFKNDAQRLVEAIFGDVEKHALSTSLEQVKATLSQLDFEQAYRLASHILTKQSSSGAANLLAAIALLGGKSADKLSDAKVLQVLHLLANATRDIETRHTALTAMGLIKYDYFILNGMSEGHPTVNEIRLALEITPANTEFDEWIEKLKTSPSARRHLLLR